MTELFNFLVILLLTGVGAVVRDYITETFPKSIHDTHFVNSIHGFITVILIQNIIKCRNIFKIIMFGFLGGFTKYSTFTKDQYILLKDKKYNQLLLYTLGTFLTALLFFYLGVFVTK